jgi:hypothetical protein
MEEQKFKALLNEVTLFIERIHHYTKEGARPLIEEFLVKHPELLQIHEKEWWFNNLQ